MVRDGGKTVVSPNSAVFWYPVVEEVVGEFDCVRSPETRFVEFDFMECLGVIDGGDPSVLPVDEVMEVVREIGFPVFVRTDLTSSKKDGLEGLKVCCEEDVVRVLAGLVDTCAMQMMTPSSFMIREWVDVDDSIVAFGGLPIGVEFRSFAVPDEFLCSHYYWPEESIRDPVCVEEECEFWDQYEEYASVEFPSCLERVSRSVAERCDVMHGVLEDESWSVDFVRDVNGEWWVLDAALGKDSFHVESCVNG